VKQAYYPFAFGSLAMTYEGETLYAVSRQSATDETGEHSAFTDLAFALFCEYFAGRRKNFTLGYELRGTAFQKTVWRVLAEIPYGEQSTYGALAAKIGKPKAARAVGQACHCNPLLILIPCHRVVGCAGKLTGYAAGLDLKSALLNLESKK